MAKNKAYTGKYDNDGKPDDEEPEVVATEAPPPGTAPAGVITGLPPEQYYTSQEAHVAEGGEYAPPPESEADAAVRKAKEAKEAEAHEKEAESKAKKSKKEEKD